MEKGKSCHVSKVLQQPDRKWRVLKSQKLERGYRNQQGEKIPLLSTMYPHFHRHMFYG
jgi:hypothetical protein